MTEGSDKKIQKEIKEVKAEAKKEIQYLEVKNAELMELLIKALKDNSKKDIGLIVSVCSLVLSVFCWLICFGFMFGAFK